LTSWLVEAGTDLPIGAEAWNGIPDFSRFVQQQRSLYVPAGDIGYWQGAIRAGDTDRGDAAALRRAIDTRERISLFLRYGDQDGGHDTVTRYTLAPDENGDWLFGIGRHWSL
jgi:hypothetical protein